MVYESDIVVVGCGLAGLSAAVSAAQEGVSVRVLERSAQAERRGTWSLTKRTLTRTL